MSKNLEELKKIKYSNNYKHFRRKKLIVDILEDFEKQIEVLNKRIKKLEQEDSYYPMSENEIRNFKVGGTD